MNEGEDDTEGDGPRRRGVLSVGGEKRMGGDGDKETRFFTAVEADVGLVLVPDVV
jgi:hypothetical protein